MRHLIAIAALGAALLPCAAGAATLPKIHVDSIDAERTGHGPTTLVLIPGLGCGPWVWQRFAASLDPAKYTVYAVTPAGFDGTPSIPGPQRFERYARGLLALIRTERLARPIIVGHSMGGELALRVAELEPDALAAAVIVDALPLFPPLAPGETIESRRARWQPLTDKMKSETDADFAAAERQAVAQMVTDPKTAADVAEHTLRSDRATLADSAYELATIDLHPDLPKIAIPVLVLAESATGYPIDATRAFYRGQYAGTSNVTVQVVPGTRHFIMLDAPDAFREAVLRFTATLK